jgi:hypothetical protein
MGRAASQTAAPPRPRHPPAATDRARHHHPRAGPACPRPHAPAQGAMAVVGRPCGLRAGSGLGLARVHSQVRPGAHRPVRQADARLDDAQAEASRAGRPLDLAGAGRLRPAAPGPPGRRRPAAAVGAAPTAAAAVTAAGTRGFPRLLCALGSPASTPKLAGRSRGRPKGRCSGPAVRHPAIKKPATKPRKKPSKAAKAT